MGLCKCPKKTVTNMFCYEHRVNVCQFCMVANHKSCVVQSYLNWLKDTDFDPNCSLCLEDLKNSECVRLLCYHVYHWACLRKHFDSMPGTTAPAGYKCPQCLAAIFPDPHLVSPVAEELKKKLELTDWGRKDASPWALSSTDSKFVEDTAKPYDEIPMGLRVGKPTFAIAKSANNFTVSRLQKAANTRKIYLPQLYTIVDDFQSKKYERKRQPFFSWRNIRCRGWQIVRMTVTVFAVFTLLFFVTGLFLLPDDAFDYYDEGNPNEYVLD